MPNVDPMSLKFNTKLDNTDFEKGTEEIRQALQSLRDTVSEISDELRSAFDLSEIQDTFNETAQTARQFASDIEDSASSFASFSGGENLDQTTLTGTRLMRDGRTWAPFPGSSRRPQRMPLKG